MSLRYLATLPGKQAVQVSVIDMHRPYLEALREQLPQAHIVIDKWHVLRQLGEVVEHVRKDIRAGLSDRARRTLMHDRHLLLKRHRDLSVQQLLLLESRPSQFPRLSAVYWRKEEFYSVYESSTLEEATTRYIAWEERVAQSGVYDAFLDFLLMVEHWGDFIFNCFRYHYTGGGVEGINSLIRSVDRAGRGYSFAVLRARLLYGQHLLRQTRKPKPKASDALEVMRVDDQAGDLDLDLQHCYLLHHKKRFQGSD